jgi:hypothetical protein
MRPRFSPEYSDIGFMAKKKLDIKYILEILLIRKSPSCIFALQSHATYYQNAPEIENAPEVEQAFQRA